MAKPKRTFSADVGQYSTGTAGPDQIEYDLDNLFNMLDPSTLLKDGSQGGIGSDNIKVGGVSDDNIGDRTIDQSQSPVSNTGKLTVLLGRLANRFRAILGGADWKSDPPITLPQVKAHIDDVTKHSGISSIDGVSNPNGNVDLVAGIGIAITPDNVGKKITIDATGSAAPAAHASTHASGGSDPVTPASIGAETPASVDSKIATHKSDPSAHHTRYTDAEAVAAVKAADGSGSGFDSDSVDGYHAGNASWNVPVSNGTLCVNLNAEKLGGQTAMQLVPPGAIMAFARSTPPDGWLECNGQAVSRTTYAALFAAIGTTFGAGDGSTTFNLPDLRGEFIRGWDHGRGVDSGRSFGTRQDDAFQGHRHRFSYQNSTAGGGLGLAGESVSVAGSSNNVVYEAVSDGINGTPRIASETRPRNIALMYCIKY